MSETTITTSSRQPRLATTRDITPFIWTLWEDVANVPAWSTAGRLPRLREYARDEPILAGGLASLLSKAVSLDWQITGGRNRVRRYQDVLANAEDGDGWNYLLDRWMQDFLVADLGGVLELARENAVGPVVGVYNIDADCLALTGNRTAPLRYYPKLSNGVLASQSLPLRSIDYVRAVDMPSADESKFGLGFSATSRALKAAKVLLALYNYEEERLRDMPMPGLVTLTGLTMEEVTAAFKLYDEKRRSKDQATFKNVLWFASQVSPLNTIKAELTSFASLPEGFDKTETITLYVYTLALDFGVDVREFWPASQTGATKAEAEVQAQKAKGKGFGRMLASVERALNWHVLPDGLQFAFDQQDSEDDLLKHTIQEKAIANIRRLWEPTMAGEGIITTVEARRLLVEARVAPEWLATSATTTGDSQAPVETDEELAQEQPPTTELVDAGIAQKARRARLDPGEDLVAINRFGDEVTLWSSRTYFMVPDWPRRSLMDDEVVQRPFGVYP